MKDYIKLHFIVLIWGFTAIIGKWIMIPAVETVFFRTLTATAAVGIWYFFKKKSFSLKLKPAEALPLMATGAVVAGHWILFFASARISTASVCLAGISTASLFTSILEPLILRKKFKPYELGLGLLVIAGLYVIFRFEFDHLTGLILALISAFLAALFSTINGGFTHKYHHMTITFYEMAGAMLAIVLFFPLYLYSGLAEGGELQLKPGTQDIVWLLVLGLVCTFYAYSVVVELLKRLSVFSTNLAINLEPVYGIILAAVFLKEHEEMSTGFYYGTLIIIIAVMLHPIFTRIEKRRTKRGEVKED